MKTTFDTDKSCATLLNNMYYVFFRATLVIQSIEYVHNLLLKPLDHI